MNKEEFNYKEEVKIDLDNLHLEWNNQTHLYQKYTEEYAEVVKTKKKLEERLEIIDAELDRDIRKDPESFGVVLLEDTKGNQKAPTETAIRNSILLQKSHQMANNNVIEAEYNINVMKGVVRSFEQRKDGLEEAARLWGANYFSTPNFPEGREYKEVIEQKKADVTSDNRKGLKRKRKD
jgi:hypothetical protein